MYQMVKFVAASITLLAFSIFFIAGCTQEQAAGPLGREPLPSTTPVAPPGDQAQPDEQASKEAPEKPVQQKPERLHIPTVWLNDTLYVSLREASKVLDFSLNYMPKSEQLWAVKDDKKVMARLHGGKFWRSGDNQLFAPVKWFEELGYQVRWNEEANHAVVSWDGRQGLLARHPKEIAVNLQMQRLFAKEGDTIVYKFITSTGKEGDETPDGNYKVLREEMYISKTYPEPTGGAKMPHALWFGGGYYIHGYHSVPGQPVSHGCVRLTEKNAKQLFDWAPVGTPVNIYRKSTEQ